MWLLEEVGVLCDVALHLVWDLVLGIDSLDWALRLAGAAVYALLGVYEELIPSVVDAVDRTDLDTGLVLGAYAGLRDHVGHLFCLLPLGLTTRHRPSSRQRRMWVTRACDLG